MEHIQRVELLTGHTSPETAYVIDDYPYGRTLRCRKRMWIETAVKGAKKGQQRACYQTTNPKRGDVWNKVHAGQYSRMVFMYLDPDNEHVETYGVSEYGVTPYDDLFLRLTGIYEQMESTDRELYDVLLKVSKRYPTPWEEFEELRQGMAAHYRSTGEIAAYDEGNKSIPGVTQRVIWPAQYRLLEAELRAAIDTARQNA